jgi:hypothetical protein
VRVLACTGDFFPIEGARRTVQRVKRIWELCGRGNDVGISEDQVMHAYTPKLAKASAEFFCRALRGAECHIDASRIKPFSPAEIWCTKDGQVRNEFPHSTFVFETVKARVEELKKSRQSLPAAERKKRAIEWLKKKVFHQRQACDLNPRYLWDKQKVEKLEAHSAIWWSHEGIMNHAYLFRDPQRADQTLPVTLAIWERGTKSVQRHWDWIEATCAAGRAIMVLDVTASGALLPHPINNGPADGHFAGLHKLCTDLLFLGDDLASMRIFDTLRALDMIAVWPKLNANDIDLYAHGRPGLYGRAAAALDPRIKKVEVARGERFEDWVADRHYEGKSNVYPVILRGALHHFDIDELQGA